MDAANSNASDDTDHVSEYVNIEGYAQGARGLFALAIPAGRVVNFPESEDEPHGTVFGIMHTLNWIGKKAVENNHQRVPFRLLKDVPELACGDPGSGNLIVQGDNLEALKALLPYYAGQVKCVYTL